MANDFGKQVKVAFEDAVGKFNDNLVMSKMVGKYKTSAQEMERSNNTIWRPVPYIATSQEGTDATGEFNDKTQLLVPSSININRRSTFQMTEVELNDALQENRLGVAAAEKLASDINISVMDTAATQGTLVVDRSTAASGFDDVAKCDEILNTQGIPYSDRKLCLSSTDYNGMASDLAARGTMNTKPTNAYENAQVGRVASFDTYKLDYANRISAAAGTTVTVNGASQYYTPVSNSGGLNVDNRYQTISITVGGGTVAVGDAFTFAGVEAVHHITKNTTGQLKTFRIHSIVTGAGGTGTVQISPPIISNEGNTEAEAMYQNVDSTPANGAALVFLNTTAAPINPFWYKDSIVLLPGRQSIPNDAGAKIMRATTDQGIEVTMSEQFDINTLKTKFRFDVFYGVSMVNPEMAGVLLFNQV